MHIHGEASLRDWGLGNLVEVHVGCSSDPTTEKLHGMVDKLKVTVFSPSKIVFCPWRYNLAAYSKLLVLILWFYMSVR